MTAMKLVNIIGQKYEFSDLHTPSLSHSLEQSSAVLLDDSLVPLSWQDLV